MKGLKSKHGFTLVEISVVIGLIAIILTMCTSFMIAYRSNFDESMDNSNIIADIDEVRAAVKDWIRYYDNGAADGSKRIKTDGGRTIYITDINNRANNLKNTDCLTIDGGWITGKHDGEVYLHQPLTSISHSEFFTYTFTPAEGTNLASQMISCQVTWGNKSSEKETLLFPIFSNTMRSRYSIKRTDN